MNTIKNKTRKTRKTRKKKGGSFHTRELHDISINRAVNKIVMKLESNPDYFIIPEEKPELRIIITRNLDKLSPREFVRVINTINLNGPIERKDFELLGIPRHIGSVADRVKNQPRQSRRLSPSRSRSRSR